MTDRSSILDGSLILIVMRDDETDHPQLVEAAVIRIPPRDVEPKEQP